MGRIKTSEVKTATFSLLQTYTDKFSADFEKNKSMLNELNIVIESKRLRNQVAGYITRKMRTKKAALETTPS